MLDEVYKKSQSIMYIGDKENSNTDSALVSTKRSLIFNELNKELYQKFFMTTEELQACRDGYIYVHDMSARRDTMNCCLFDVKSVLEGGFEMGNLWYNEPKTLAVAFDVIGDITLSAASQQYGGFTVPSVDLLLEPYAEKSYKKQYDRYKSLGLSDEAAEREAIADVKVDFEQGFQGWEYKFNSVSSSRGDYPFITMTAGTGTGRFAKMASITMLDVRRKGQERRTARSRFCSRRSCSFTTRTSTVPESHLRTCSGLALSAAPRLCTPTGSASPETDMLPPSTRNTAG